MWRGWGERSGLSVPTRTHRPVYLARGQAQRGEPREPEVLASASQTRLSPESRAGLQLRALPVTRSRRNPLGGRHRNKLCLLARPASPAGGRAGRFLLEHRVEDGSGSVSEGPWVQGVLDRSQRLALAALGQVPPPPPAPGFCR